MIAAGSLVRQKGSGLGERKGLAVPASANPSSSVVGGGFEPPSFALSYCRTPAQPAHLGSLGLLTDREARFDGFVSASR